MQVLPPLTTIRLLQADQVRGQGLTELAGRMQARAMIPIENFSADMVRMVEKAIEKGGTTTMLAPRVQTELQPAGRTFKCFKCKKKIPIASGKTRKAAVADHRSTCR